jgi:hypothetical protein
MQIINIASFFKKQKKISMAHVQNQEQERNKIRCGKADWEQVR